MNAMGFFGFFPIVCSLNMSFLLGITENEGVM